MEKVPSRRSGFLAVKLVQTTTQVVTGESQDPPDSRPIPPQGAVMPWTKTEEVREMPSHHRLDDTVSNPEHETTLPKEEVEYIGHWRCRCRHLLSVHAGRQSYQRENCKCSVFRPSIVNTCLTCNHAHSLHGNSASGRCRAMGCKCPEWIPLPAGAVRRRKIVITKEKYGAGSEDLTQTLTTQTERRESGSVTVVAKYSTDQSHEL